MTEITREKLSSIRKYLYEYVLIILVACVAFLFGLYIKVNNFIIDDMVKDKLEMRLTIDRNTNVIQSLRISNK